MNILFVYTSAINPEEGGVQRVTSFLGAYFEEHNITVYYLSAKKSKTHSNIMSNQYYLPVENDVYNEENILFYKQFVKLNEIDIIINQAALGGNMSRFCASAKSSSNAKIISVIHNSLLGNVLNFTNSHSRQIKKVPIPFLVNVLETKFAKNFLKFLYKLKYKKAYQFTCDNSDKVVVLSEGYYKELKIFVPNYNSDKVYAIPNPCTLNISTSVTQKINEILYVGRINTSQKKVDSLLKVWKVIFKEHPNWNLSILGEGEGKFELETQARRLGLERITFHGVKNPIPFYERSKILCMTSAYEGFPLVLAEAQVFGTIPIAFDSFASIRDIITHKQSGFLIKPFNINDYAECLSELMINEEKMNLMAHNCQKSVRQFSVENVGKIWIELFYKLSK